MTKVLGHAEDVMQLFIVENFADRSEQAVIYNLRAQRDSDYFQAFLQFQQHNQKEVLLQTLHLLIEKDNNQFKFPMLKTPTSPSQQKLAYLKDVFSNALKDFSNRQHIALLQQNFAENDQSAVMQILNSYYLHKEHERMMNELSMLAAELE